MRNEFISSIRSQISHPHVAIDFAPEQGIGPSQTARLELEEISNAFDELSHEKWVVLWDIAINDRGYEDLSAETGCAVGTLKSRLHRARLELRAD
jgi:RNA polymerase sigma-70 factor, ECF subfamily